MDKSISAACPAQGGEAPDSRALHNVDGAMHSDRYVGNAILVSPAVASLFLLFSRKSSGEERWCAEGRALPISRYFM